jgi:hypothetical protein
MNDRKYRIEAVLSLLTATVLVTLGLYGPALAAQSMEFTPDQVLVSFHPGTPGHVIAAAHANVGGKVQKSIDGLGVHVVGVPHGTVLHQVAAYQKNPNIKRVLKRLVVYVAISSS